MKAAVVATTPRNHEKETFKVFLRVFVAPVRLNAYSILAQSDRRPAERADHLDQIQSGFRCTSTRLSRSGRRTSRRLDSAPRRCTWPCDEYSGNACRT